MHSLIMTRHQDTAGTRLLAETDPFEYLDFEIIPELPLRIRGGVVGLRGCGATQTRTTVVLRG
jgi:hypothetical protein